LDSFFNQGSDEDSTGDESSASDSFIPPLILNEPDLTEAEVSADLEAIWYATKNSMEFALSKVELTSKVTKTLECLQCDPLTCAATNACKAIKQFLGTKGEIFIHILEAVSLA
jgi:hypothetical protein